MIRVAINFSRPAGGSFAHFAHFVCDFALPFFSFLRKEGLLDSLIRGHGIVLEMPDRFATKFGPLFPLVCELFPSLKINYVTRFTIEPIHHNRQAWQNDVDDIDHFVSYLKKVLSAKPTGPGTIVVKRGLDRERYPGRSTCTRSGADRRTIGVGFEELVVEITKKRPDAKCVVLEQLSFPEQVSIFLAADTLIGQHGAAFVHSHWMPKGSHLIELQCSHLHQLPTFVPTIAALRNHRVSTVCYPCTGPRQQLTMSVVDPTFVTSLLS